MAPLKILQGISLEFAKAGLIKAFEWFCNSEDFNYKAYQYLQVFFKIHTFRVPFSAHMLKIYN